MREPPAPDKWALVLGASSGFGAATARALAAAGHHVVGVHLDRRATQPLADAVARDIEAAGRRAVFHNVNAANPDKRRAVIEQMRALVPRDGGALRVVLHSLAFGTLRPYLGEDAVSPEQMQMTADVMAHSLVWWTRDLAAADLLGPGCRILAMTSAGSTLVWPTYGPVSAAKAALEAHCRQLACELAPRGVTVNAILAGVTDTPALRKIPGHERLMETALRRHPRGRLTRPEDVARAVVALAADGTDWMTGNVIRVDGGETLTG